MWQFVFGLSSLLGVGSSIYGATQASTEAKYNAELMRERAELITKKQKMTATQWDRQIARAGGTLIANVAKSGLEFSGSPIVAMIDMTKQMMLDKQTELYNLEIEKRGASSQADAYQRQGKTALYTGYANTFSKALTSYADYKNWGK